MNTDKFITAYNESRNGANHFCRNPLYPKFLYSDGVAECAQAGCYWLLDILGTELPAQFKKRQRNKRQPWYGFCIVKVTVRNESATILGEWQDDDHRAWLKKVTYTDMPDGEWLFYVSDMVDHFSCILPTEY